MSQSPARAGEGVAGESAQYIEGWSALERLIRDGESFSGRERNCAYVNLGGRGFAAISAASGIDFPDDARSLGVADWDGDGDLDLWIRNRSSPGLRFMRNDMETGHRWLAVRLQAPAGNTDAIGARLELHLPGRAAPLVRTVRAGEGFRSQSSRWVHFGLGDATRIERLVVRWPGGATEEHAGLQPDTRIVLGPGERPRLAPPRPNVRSRLAPSEPPVAAPSGKLRLVPVSPIPLPSAVTALLPPRTGEAASPPVRLVNLWATWCAPCVVELAAFSKGHASLRSAGVEIVALSVDGLGEDKGTTADPIAFARERSLPFPVSRATREAVDALNLVQCELLDACAPLPVPTSLLVDRENRITAIYKGPVEVSQVLADAALPATQPDERLARGLPWPGTWNDLPDFSDFTRLARALEAAGLPGDADAQRAELISRRVDIQVRSSVAELSRGRMAAAEGFVEEALRLDPRSVPARLQRAALLQRQGRADEASREVAAILVANPADARVHARAGELALESGRADAAQASFREALRLDPASQGARVGLALAARGAGRMDEAITLMREAVASRPGDATTQLRLARLLGEAGRADEAASVLADAVRAAPDVASNLHQAGLGFLAMGRARDGVTHLREAARRASADDGIRLSVAQILASHPDAAVRDGATAVDLASGVVAAGGRRDPVGLAALAAAQAEAGKFDDASGTVAEALALARTATPDLVPLLEEFTRLFAQRQPYRQPQQR